MARERLQKKKAALHELPLTTANYKILGIALLCIVLGFIALSQEPWDGFMPLVAAPILLVLGYCVLVPLGILYQGKGERQAAVAGGPPEKIQAHNS